MKSNQMVDPVIDVEGNRVVFNINDGGEALVLDMSRLHPAILARAALAGMAQVRIIDAAAVSATDAEGEVRSVEERMRLKRERMAALIAHYQSGTDQWSIRAAGEGGGGKSLTIEAIARVQGVDYAEAKRRVEAFAAKRFGGDGKKALAELRGPKVREVMEEIKRERNAAKPAKEDADKLLEELEGE